MTINSSEPVLNSLAKRGNPAIPPLSQSPKKATNPQDIFSSFTDFSSAPRTLTDAPIAKALREAFPHHHLILNDGRSCDLLAFAAAGHATATLIEPVNSIILTRFVPPTRRQDGGKGSFASDDKFASYSYDFKGRKLLLYVVEGWNGTYNSYPMNYILAPSGPETGGIAAATENVNGLLRDVTIWGLELHDEVLMFDGGFWNKNPELWKSIQMANWEDVILAEEKKEALIADVDGFFAAEKDYAEFAVPWKRGLIFYGPPGNGKTISIKALMHSLSTRTSPTIGILYVKSLQSWGGPEYSLHEIFTKAREQDPCILIFEDLDSLVTDSVRSYFLNEVDGLEANHGVLMIGSTNHLDRLDPGIANRPSRFDRKYFFDLPTRLERIQYCEYWRNKLKGNKNIDFPKILCSMIAGITAGFSFAYLKEAFVATLLVIVREGKAAVGGGAVDPEDTKFWKEIKKQIENLRREMETGGDATVEAEAIAPEDSQFWKDLHEAIEKLQSSIREIEKPVLG